MWRQKQNELAANYVKPTFPNLLRETSGISPIPETGYLFRCDVRPWLEFDLVLDSFLLSLKTDHEAWDRLYRDVTLSPQQKTPTLEYFAQLKMYQ
jgi:hypothetical protein